MAARPHCFFISPIGPDDSPQRKNSDDVMEFILVPALGDDLEVVRADQIQKSGLITRQIIELLRDAELVVADLTGWNCNVLYELAIRHCLQKPTIQLITKGEQLPFDLHDHRTIEYTFHAADVKKAIASVKSFADSSFRGARVENPVTFIFSEAASNDANIRNLKQQIAEWQLSLGKSEYDRTQLERAVQGEKETVTKLQSEIDMLKDANDSLTEKITSKEQHHLKMIDNVYRDKREPFNYPAYCIGCFHKLNQRVPLILSDQYNGCCPVCGFVVCNVYYPHGAPRTS